MELARLIQDKEEVLKHVEKQRIKREEQENREMEELEELSPIKQKQILKQIQNEGTSPLLRNQKTILKLTRMLSQRPSPTLRLSKQLNESATPSAELSMSPGSKTPLNLNNLKKQETEQLNLAQNRLTAKLSDVSIS